MRDDRSAASLAAQVDILEMLATQAPHIAEPTDEAMTHMEAGMAAASERVNAALADLRRSGRQAESVKAQEALNRFLSINAEIVRLSRRNSNVRSLALALGKKQTLAAECDAQLQAIEASLVRHEFRATR